jgi:uncharacterized FAD-dependent dehydrogenase
MIYDLIIVGAGPSGIFTALELSKARPDKKILIIEQGKSIEKRNCPKDKTKICINCQPYCNITTGFSGAGAFSDGKLSLSPEVGGFERGSDKNGSGSSSSADIWLYSCGNIQSPRR